MRSKKQKFVDAVKMRALLAYLEQEEAKVCNCAGCETLLLSKASLAELESKEKPKGVKLPAAVAGRINHRPYGPCCFGKAFEQDVESRYENN
jgi:hypothetical protein